jgi:hypothetical protein
MEPRGSPETSAQNYQYTLVKIPGEGRSRMEGGRMGIFLTNTYLHNGSAACSWFHLSNLVPSAPTPAPWQTGTVRNAVPSVGKLLLHTARSILHWQPIIIFTLKWVTLGTHCGGKRRLAVHLWHVTTTLTKHTVCHSICIRGYLLYIYMCYMFRPLLPTIRG